MIVETERDIDCGWVGPKEVVWSLTFPDGQAPPPSIVAQIRKILPGYVPLFCTRAFVGPDGQKETFQYHVIGMWRQSPDPECPDFHRILSNINRPFDFPFKGGVIYEQYSISAPWPDGSWQKARLTPDIPLCCVSCRTRDEIAREKSRCLSESIPQLYEPFVVDGYERITRPPIEMHWEKTRDWVEKSVKFTKLIGDTFFERLEQLRLKRHELQAAEGKRIDADADYRIKTDGLYKRAVQNGWFVPLPRDITPWAPKPFCDLRSAE
jgi:hypothetical protein